MKIRTAILNTVLCVTPLAAAAQMGNPAGMGVDTRMTKPGFPAPHQTNNQDRLFAQLAIAGGVAEVDFGKLAGEKAKADAVQRFAEMMVRDHSDAKAKLKDLADAAKIPVSDQLDAEHSILRDRLQKLNGDDFDAAYVKSQIVDHQKNAQLLSWEISMGEDADMQRLAAALLPKVLDHLRMAQELNNVLTGAAIRLPPQEMAKKSGP